MRTDVSPETYFTLVQTLYREAELLDNGDFDGWLDMMASDVQYDVPIRLTRERGNDATYSVDAELFAEDLETLRLRVARLHTDFAWAEDPPSRTRRFVGNIRVAAVDGSPSELAVRSYLMLYRNRGEEVASDLISGERQDIWRNTEGAWKLAKRLVLIDQSILGTKNLAIFL